MKRLFITTLLALAGHAAFSQEIYIDSMVAGSYTGWQQTGVAGEILYLPYFTTNKESKKNFVIRRVNAESFAELETTRLELPQSYVLKASGSTNMSYLLNFFDKVKNENVLMVVTGDNINKKITSKAGNEQVFPISDEENLLALTIGKNGGYTLSMLDKELENKWKKSMAPSGNNNWNILSAKSENGNVSILRQENSADGKTSFMLDRYQSATGIETSHTKIAIDNNPVYPTFFTNSDMGSFCGGYIFKDGKPAGKPDAFFLGNISEDGTIQNNVTVPYSQLIEDLKKDLGSSLGNEHTGIIFTGAVLSNELPGFVMAGQLYSRETKANGEVNFKVGDFVIVRFNTGMEYKGAYAIKARANATATVKNVPANLPDITLATYMCNAGFTYYRQFLPLPGKPTMQYVITEADGVTRTCYAKVGSLKTKTEGALCVDMTRSQGKAKDIYSYTVNTPIKDAAANDIIIQRNYSEFGKAYDLGDNHMIIWKYNMPKREDLPADGPPENDDEGERPQPPLPVVEEENK